MILTCAIIDDEPLAAELLESYAKKTPELHLVGVYGSAVEAMKELRNNPVDLLFLDIQMPEPKKTKVIFTTAFDRYAIDGYKVNAVDYLLKPISYDSFVLSVNRVLERCRDVDRQDVMSADGFVYVKSEYKLVKINFDDILYIEGVKDYVKIYFRDRRKPVMSLMNMKKLEDYLPKSQFMRVHRSFIVNMSVADMIDRGRIVAGDTFIPVSESYKEQVQEYIDRHTLV